MEIKNRLWTCLCQTRCCSTVSLSVEACSWLQSIPGRSSNAMEYLLCFEMPCKYDFRFQNFDEKLQFGYAFLSNFSCMYQLGFTMPLYVKLSRSKQSPKVHWINVWIFDFHHIFFNLFSMQILPNMDDLVPLRWCTKSLAYNEHICCTKKI